MEADITVFIYQNIEGGVVDVTSVWVADCPCGMDWEFGQAGDCLHGAVGLSSILFNFFGQLV